MRHKYIFCFLFLLIGLSYGQNKQWKIDSEVSFITYKGYHLLHSWEGINNNVNGIAIPNLSDDRIEKLAILIYARDFYSDNSGRDAHALEVLEVLNYPEIRFYSEAIKILDNKVNIKGTFDFHGVKIDKEFSANLKTEISTWEFSGNFKLTPTDFKIELPSFLSIKMKNILDIKYSIVLKR